MSVILQDSGSNYWLVGVSDDGTTLNTTPVGAGPANPPTFIDHSNTSYWLLTVDTAGNLGTSSGVAPGVDYVILISPGGYAWQLSVVPGTSGSSLQTTAVPGVNIDFDLVPGTLVMWGIS